MSTVNIYPCRPPHPGGGSGAFERGECGASTPIVPTTMAVSCAIASWTSGVFGKMQRRSVTPRCASSIARPGVRLGGRPPDGDRDLHGDPEPGGIPARGLAACANLLAQRTHVLEGGGGNHDIIRHA